MARRIAAMFEALVVMASGMSRNRYSDHIIDIEYNSPKRKGSGKGKTGSGFNRRTRGEKDASLRSRSRRSR